MKRWLKGDVMNAANTPRHGDVLVDGHNNAWEAKLGPYGYTLRDCDGNTHSDMKDVDWIALLRWWNGEHLLKGGAE